jgi:hypothetical protein
VIRLPLGPLAAEIALTPGPGTLGL